MVNRRIAMAKANIISELENTDEIVLGTMGRVSKRETSRPVWFVRSDETLFLLPIRGAASHWYRNVLATPTIRIQAGRAEHDTEATPITDPELVGRVVDGFRAKYGADQVATHYPRPEVAVAAPLA
jgi:hypothetical protein